MRTLQELLAWIAALDPAAAFLFSLPFLVGAAGIARVWFDERRNPRAPRYQGRPPIPRQRSYGNAARR